MMRLPSGILIARDRVGVKPIYFTKRAGLFAFASEIKALLAHPNVPATVGQVALYHYLTYLTTPAPLTLFDGIYKLPAGHFMMIEANGNFAAGSGGAVPGQSLNAHTVSEKALPIRTNTISRRLWIGWRHPSKNA